MVPDLPIHYTTFMGLRWRIRVVYRWASLLLRPFEAKFGTKFPFLFLKGKNGVEMYNFRGPRKAHSSVKQRHLTIDRNRNKKLIRRWDSERELSLRRHCTRTRKYNRLLHKFRHRSFSATQVNQLQWNIQIMQCNGHYAVQGHSRSPILVPIESSYTTSY